MRKRRPWPTRTGLELRPDLPTALRTRAMLLADAGRLDEAIADLQKSLQTDPKDTATLLQLGTLETARKPAKAVEIFSSVLKLLPDEWQAFRGRGDAYLNLGRQAEAVADYEQGLQREPNDPGTLNNLAWVLATSPDAKLRDGRRAVRLATAAGEATGYKRAYILSTLAAAYAETGDFPSARKWSAKAIETGDREQTARSKGSWRATRPASPGGNCSRKAPRPNRAGPSPKRNRKSFLLRKDRVPCPRLPWACGVFPRYSTCPRQAWAWHPSSGPPATTTKYTFTPGFSMPCPVPCVLAILSPSSGCRRGWRGPERAAGDDRRGKARRHDAPLSDAASGSSGSAVEDGLRKAEDARGRLPPIRSDLRQKCLEAIGGLPERTPLEPQMTGTVSRPGYRVEKIIFQSQPKHYVTALLVPARRKRFQPPYPGVIVPCGHASEAKGHAEYQSMGALLALNGMAALVFDPIDQGERGQYLGQGGWPALQLHGRPRRPRHRLHPAGPEHGPLRDLGRHAGDRLSPISARGRSAADRLHGQQRRRHANQLPDGDRQPHPRVPPQAATSTSLPKLLATSGPQDSGTAPLRPIGFSPWTMPTWIMMRAPSPVLICAATKDFFDIGGTWDTFRYAKRLYTRLGLRRTRRHLGKRRRTQLQHPATRRRGTLDVAMAVGQGSGDHRAADHAAHAKRIPMHCRTAR